MHAHLYEIRLDVSNTYRTQFVCESVCEMFECKLISQFDVLGVLGVVAIEIKIYFKLRQDR